MWGDLMYRPPGLQLPWGGQQQPMLGAPGQVPMPMPGFFQQPRVNPGFLTPLMPRLQPMLGDSRMLDLANLFRGANRQGMGPQAPIQGFLQSPLMGRFR